MLEYICKREKTVLVYQVSYAALGKTNFHRSTMKLIGPLWPTSTADLSNALLKNMYKDMNGYIRIRDCESPKCFRILLGYLRII